MPNELHIHNVRVKRLELENFRGFGNIAIDLHPEKSVTVLIADNGGGKTSILDALAVFLQRFLHVAIFGKAEWEMPFPVLSEKDILNERNNSLCSIQLESTYFTPDPGIFKFLEECTKWLNEEGIHGMDVRLGFDPEDDIWVFYVKQDENKIVDLYSSEVLQNWLDELGPSGKKVLETGDNFIIATHNGENWQSNVGLSTQEVKNSIEYNGLIEFKFELVRNAIVQPNFFPIETRASKISDLISQFDGGKGLVADFLKSMSSYDSVKPERERITVLPLLAYYKGAAINARYGDSIKIPYSAQPFEAYQNALVPERFNFEDFLSWFLHVASGDTSYIADLVKSTILDVLNADRDWYTELCLEQGELKIYKNTEGTIAPVGIIVNQLSAGEKNLFALIGDLVKRVVQLNPVLFKVDYDPETSTYSNPLHFTPGIVLIDEIDLHLHPRWQRIIIPKLREHFPKVQFIVTTHSPFVLQSISPDSRIRINDGKIEYFVGEPVTDYEVTLIDYFMMNEFFDVETETQLGQFRSLTTEVAQGKRKKDDSKFKQIIKELAKKGEFLKEVLAVELAQLKND